MNFDLHPDEVASLASYDPRERRISVFADSENGSGMALAVAGHVGARVIFNGSPEEGIERLRTHAPGEAVFVDIAHDGGAALDIFLDRLDERGLTDGVPILVNVAPDCLDPVAARLRGSSVVLMSQATIADWVASLALFSTARDLVLHDVATDDSLRLQRLADEVQRIARTLAELVGPDPPPLRGVSDAITGFRGQPGVTSGIQNEISAQDVRAIIRLRRMRERFFRSDLFADPAWDMLLDLMAARLELMRVAVSSLCIAAAVPPTTALRWIKTMSENGMFVRIADPDDGRRVFIELSEGAASGMAAYLAAAKDQGGLAI